MFEVYKYIGNEQTNMYTCHIIVFILFCLPLLPRISKYISKYKKKLHLHLPHPFGHEIMKKIRRKPGCSYVD